VISLGGSLESYPQPDIDGRTFLNFIDEAQTGLLRVSELSIVARVTGIQMLNIERVSDIYQHISDI